MMNNMPIFYGPAYYSRHFHSFRMETNVRTESPIEEFLKDWLVRNCEFIDHYQPRVVYFDWWIQNQAFKPYLKNLPHIIIIVQRNGDRRFR